MSDPQVTSPRHPFELLFAQLTGAMSRPGAPVVHELGPVANGVAGQPGRVVWTERTSESVSRGYRLQGNGFSGFKAILHDVETYGGTPLEVAQTEAAIEGWLDILVGPPQGAPGAGNGYKIGKGTPLEVGDGTSTGCSRKLAITLYLPVFQMVLGEGTVAVGGVSLNTTVLAPAGTTPSGDTLNPQQATA